MAAPAALPAFLYRHWRALVGDGPPLTLLHLCLLSSLLLAVAPDGRRGRGTLLLPDGERTPLRYRRGILGWRRARAMTSVGAYPTLHAVEDVMAHAVARAQAALAQLTALGDFDYPQALLEVLLHVTLRQMPGVSVFARAPCGRPDTLSGRGRVTLLVTLRGGGGGHAICQLRCVRPHELAGARADAAEELQRLRAATDDALLQEPLAACTVEAHGYSRPAGHTVASWHVAQAVDKATHATIGGWYEPLVRAVVIGVGPRLLHYQLPPPAAHPAPPPPAVAAPLSAPAAATAVAAQPPDRDSSMSAGEQAPEKAEPLPTPPS